VAQTFASQNLFKFRLSHQEATTDPFSWFRGQEEAADVGLQDMRHPVAALELGFMVPSYLLNLSIIITVCFYSGDGFGLIEQSICFLCVKWSDSVFCTISIK
jgi:hypothetical protein